MFNVVIDPFYTVAFTLAIVNIFAVADIIRGALNDFPQQYLIAAKVTGLTCNKPFSKYNFLWFCAKSCRRFVLQVAMLHITLFSSLISVEEIFRVAQRINAQIYRPLKFLHRSRSLPCGMLTD